MFISPHVVGRLTASELRDVRAELQRAVRLIDNHLEMIDLQRDVDRRREIPFSHQIRDAQRVLRIIRIMRLARTGLDNAAIAAKLGLHPGSVSRIIQRELRAARWPEDQARDHVPDGADPDAWRLQCDAKRYRLRND